MELVIIALNVCFGFAVVSVLAVESLGMALNPSRDLHERTDITTPLLQTRKLRPKIPQLIKGRHRDKSR